MVQPTSGPARESEGAVCSTFVDACCRALRIALRHVHERVCHALGAGWDVMSARVCPRDQLAADASYSLLGCCCFAIALRYSSLTSYLLRTYLLLTSHLLLTYFRLTFTPHRNLILPRRNFSSHTYSSHSNFSSHTYLSHSNFFSHTYSSHSDFSSHTYLSHSNFSSHTYLSHINFSPHTYFSHSKLPSHTYSSHSNLFSHTYLSHINFSSHTYSSHSNFFSHTYLSHSISFGDHAREPMAHAMFDSYQSLGVDLGIELVWPLQVIARDIAEMQPRCSRDAAEMQSRCSRDAVEMQPRCRRDAAEMCQARPHPHVTRGRIDHTTTGRRIRFSHRLFCYLTI